MDWGPAAWKFLHTVTFMYPDNPNLEEQTAAENLFQSLRKLLPCERCRTHYEEEISLSPPNVSSKVNLSKWLVDMHNRVNVRLGKTVYSYEQASSEYSSQCSADCGGSTVARETPQRPKNAVNNSNNLGLVLFLCAVLTCVALFHAYKNYKT